MKTKATTEPALLGTPMSAIVTLVHPRTPEGPKVNARRPTAYPAMDNNRAATEKMSNRGVSGHVIPQVDGVVRHVIPHLAVT
ncbi:hypothetical protein DFR67_13130 [Williamsia limnetica]|uniref:Uncharacterized protein n=1 Tax=Williamsia limnetica TaxID=882452 RepID=A0A318RFP1_WILLI|nr:hypothetical protein DFR67_13130 [Williamsia limnetica]